MPFRRPFGIDPAVGVTRRVLSARLANEAVRSSGFGTRRVPTSRESQTAADSPATESIAGGPLGA
jgi:hypothetical protein